MDVGKNINLSRLKETLLGIFTGIYGFWIFISIAFFVLIMIFIVFIYALPSSYNKAYHEINDLISASEQYAFKKDVYNDKWISSKKQESELYDKECEKCSVYLKERDTKLESFFLIEDAERGMVKIEDEALWRYEYIERVSALLTKLGANNIAVNEGALPFHTWGSDIPTWDIILPVQKRFWILESLINIATNNTGIRRIEKISFQESSPTYNPSLANIYTVIPITFKVALQSEYVKYLLHEILKSDIPFVIESVNILSTDEITNLRSTNENGTVLDNDIGDNSLKPVIDVTIDAYVIDYKA